MYCFEVLPCSWPVVLLFLCLYVYHFLTGSFFCDCGPGYMLYNGTQCSDTNECELNAECDQKCINHAGYYECGCRQGFTLDTDGKR